MPKERPTTFKPGNPGGPGRPRGSLAPKNILRAVGAPGFDYKAECARRLVTLVKEVDSETKKKADKSVRRLAVLTAVEEKMADRLYGRPAQAITGANGGPLVVAFSQILEAADGGGNEKVV